MKEKKVLYLLIAGLLVFLVGFNGCKYRTHTKYEKFDLTKSFEYSQEYELAKVVQKQKVKKILKLCKENPSFVQKTYTEKYYSVLHMAAESGKALSVKALLDAGMNPNVMTENYVTPLYIVSSDILYRYKLGYECSECIELLIKYGADCNIRIKDTMIDTPFINAVDAGFFDYADIMFQKGNVNINEKMNWRYTYSVYLFEKEIKKKKYERHNYIKSIHYLVCRCKADITDYYLDNGKKYPVSLLRQLIYPLDSEEYKLKQEIIEEFKNQGIDYYSEPIPEETLDKIKKLYPDSWEEYIKVY